MAKIIKLTEGDLSRIVRRVIKEENEAETSNKVEMAKDALKDILKPSELRFLQQKFQEEGKEGFKDEVVAAVEDVKSSENGELSEEDMGGMSDDEFKLRSIIHKIINKGSVLALAGILPAAMMGAPAAAVGLGIASLVGMSLKDAAFWKRNGHDKYQTGHHYGVQNRAERETMRENYRRRRNLKK